MCEPQNREVLFFVVVNFTSFRCNESREKAATSVNIDNSFIGNFLKSAEGKSRSQILTTKHYKP